MRLLAGHNLAAKGRILLGYRMRGVPPFSPLSLFSSGEQGAWYDPSDLSTMFTDTAGATPATVGDPVALLLDKSQGLEVGPELVTNGDFSDGATGWSLGANTTISDGVASFNYTGFAGMLTAVGASVVAERFYRISFDLLSRSSGSIRPVLGNTTISTNTSLGTKTFSYVRPAASLTSGLSFIGSGNGFVGSITNVSVRELLGNHATQATAAARPTLTAGTPSFLRSDLVDDAILWTASAGTDYTIARLNSAGVVTILTEQSLSGSTDIFLEQDIAAYIAVNRALTEGETSGLTAYLEAL